VNFIILILKKPGLVVVLIIVIELLINCFVHLLFMQHFVVGLPPILVVQLIKPLDFLKFHFLVLPLLKLTSFDY